MCAVVTNIQEASFDVRESSRGEPNWRCLDLSGEHLGVRIEELPPGSSSSYHHYHTAEEEHVLITEGSGTLHLGSESITVTKGDHIGFPAGDQIAHHIENTSMEPLAYLVFGERKSDDVVIYPENNIALVKSAKGHQWYRFEDYVGDD